MDTAIRDLKEFQTVKKLGYDGIGWKIGTPAEVAAAVKEVRQQGLKLFAMYSYPSATLTKASLLLDPQYDAVMRELEGTDAVIWLSITSKDFSVSSPDGDSIAVPALRKLADLAARHGLRAAIYPHKSNWTERVQDAVRLAKKVDRKNFGVTFNLCHCLMVGDEAKIPALLPDAAPYLFLVTINGAGPRRSQYRLAPAHSSTGRRDVRREHRFEEACRAEVLRSHRLAGVWRDNSVKGEPPAFYYRVAKTQGD